MAVHRLIALGLAGLLLSGLPARAADAYPTGRCTGSFRFRPAAPPT
jgi:hypothetical protein